MGLFKNVGQDLVLNAIKDKIKEINPQELLEVFGNMVKDEVAQLKAQDSDGDHVDDFTNNEADMKVITEAGSRIAKRLEAAHTAISAKKK